MISMTDAIKNNIGSNEVVPVGVVTIRVSVDMDSNHPIIHNDISFDGLNDQLKKAYSNCLKSLPEQLKIVMKERGL